VTDTGLRDAIIDAALSNPDSAFSKAVANLGLDATTLKEAGDALPSLVSAAQHAAGGRWEEAGLAIADAAEHAPELVAAALQGIASHLDGPAAAILGGADVAAALADARPDALRALVPGAPAGALQHLADNAELRDAVIDAAMAGPDSGFAETVAALGLTADDLKSAGEGLPDLMEAVGLAATAQTPAEWQAAALALVDAAEHAPELVAKGIE